MIALVQRVISASVSVNSHPIASINQGMLVLLGVERSDETLNAEKLAKKIAQFRMFSDSNGKMNLSIQEVSGEMLVVSQFTLVANTQQGNRPGFSLAAPPVLGRQRYEEFIESLRQKGVTVKTGQFAADMQVSLINDGPVTFHFKQ